MYLDTLLILFISIATALLGEGYTSLHDLIINVLMHIYAFNNLHF